MLQHNINSRQYAMHACNSSGFVERLMVCYMSFKRMYSYQNVTILHSMRTVTTGALTLAAMSH
jgi:hypothetical protein